MWVTFVNSTSPWSSDWMLLIWRVFDSWLPVDVQRPPFLPIGHLSGSMRAKNLVIFGIWRSWVRKQHISMTHCLDVTHITFVSFLIPYRCAMTTFFAHWAHLGLHAVYEIINFPIIVFIMFCFAVFLNSYFPHKSDSIASKKWMPPHTFFFSSFILLHSAGGGHSIDQLVVYENWPKA